MHIFCTKEKEKSQAITQSSFLITVGTKQNRTNDGAASVCKWKSLATEWGRRDKNAYKGGSGKAGDILWNFKEALPLWGNVWQKPLTLSSARLWRQSTRKESQNVPLSWGPLSWCHAHRRRPNGTHQWTRSPRRAAGGLCSVPRSLLPLVRQSGASLQIETEGKQTVRDLEELDALEWSTFYSLMWLQYDGRKKNWCWCIFFILYLYTDYRTTFN